MMNKVERSYVVAILAVLSLALPMAGFSAENKDKLVVASLNVAGPSPGENISRGEFVTITAKLKSDSVAKAGSLKVRIYLSTSRDGLDVQHEFDVFHDLSPGKPSDASVINHESNNFHDVFQDQSGNISVTGQYIIPYTIAPGDSYWVVAEVSPEDKPFENSGSNTKTIHSIIVPCDKLVSYDNTNHCGDQD